MQKTQETQIPKAGIFSCSAGLGSQTVHTYLTERPNAAVRKHVRYRSSNLQADMMSLARFSPFIHW